MSKINVNDTKITIISIHDEDYISLTDMVRNIDEWIYTLPLIQRECQDKDFYVKEMAENVMVRGSRL